MPSLMLPSIDLDSALDALSAQTWYRGNGYAREGRVLSSLWQPDLKILSGTVRGSQGHTYKTMAVLSPVATETYAFEHGF